MAADLKKMTPDQFRKYQEQLVENRHWRNAEDLAVRKAEHLRLLKEEEDRKERLRFYGKIAVRCLGLVAFYKVMTVFLIPGFIDLMFFVKSAMAAW